MAKIYVSTIATFAIAALGLANTPLVAAAVDDESEPAGRPTSAASPDVAALSEETESVSPASSDDGETEAVSGDVGRITLLEDRGVDLDAPGVKLLPTDGTPGLDIALDYDADLYTPSGAHFQRSTTAPTSSTCSGGGDIDRYGYDDIDEGQWFCAVTSDGIGTAVQVVDMVKTSGGGKVTVEYERFGSVAPPSPSEDTEAVITDAVTLTEDHGIDLDTESRDLLPTDGTLGLDIALDYDADLYTPDGVALMRDTSRPDADRCEDLTDVNRYNDYDVGQWLCLTTSHGTIGALEVTDVVRKSSGDEVAVRYHLFGEPAVPNGTDADIDPATRGEVTLSESQGIDIDRNPRQLLPTDDTLDFDVALEYDADLYAPDGVALVRATAIPTAERCADISERSSSYAGYAAGQWFCFTTSDGASGRFKVTKVTNRSDSPEVSIAYALFR